ncbi:hypothetical protein D9758_008452 [Tetrapyrgos nigripes]|uniref:Uncharacterized protein n=1 Tax=Tetrapyrgos nigripes TaxID=182062 RepID=A0A8H5CNY8_9AGAR|nr:hypothetical protein D9758_008452 [Tetrapyrgos nigripes]
MLNIWIRLIVIGMFAHFGCTISLSLVTLLTNFAFDPNVWILDIDASPSPFPAPILLAYVFPCLFPRPREMSFSLTGDSNNTPNPNRDVCYSNGPWNCPAKPSTLQVQNPQYIPVASSDASSSFPKIAQTSGHMKVSASKLLVQVPDAAQRRMSCSVSFMHATEGQGTSHV